MADWSARPIQPLRRPGFARVLASRGRKRGSGEGSTQPSGRAKDGRCSLPLHKIASMPLRRITFNSTRAGRSDALCRAPILTHDQRSNGGIWRKQPLRQEKSWKGGGLCNLKPFEAIQRVRPPPGRGAARQPEASFARAAATSLVKRRQRMLKPCVSLDILYPLRPSVWVDRGRRRQGRQRRGLAGSAGVLELGKGMGRIARKPERSRSRPRAQRPD